MMPKGVPLEYFLMSENAPKTGSGRSWRDAEDVFVEPPVIFPRVHVARNIGGFNPNSPHLCAVGFEERAQASIWVEV